MLAHMCVDGQQNPSFAQKAHCVQLHCAADPLHSTVPQQVTPAGGLAGQATGGGALSFWGGGGAESCA